MSYFVVRVLVPGYEDEDQYGSTGNAFAGWPDMWPEEKYAEGALYREWKQMAEEWRLHARMARLDRELHADKERPWQQIAEKALVSIARENGWQQRERPYVHILLNPIYVIPPATPEEEEECPTRWTSIVRWMDAKMSKAESEAARRKVEQRAAFRRREPDRLQIDTEALRKMMEDMMPKPEPANRFAFIHDIQTRVCAMLAEENGWTKTDPRCVIVGSTDKPWVYRIE